MTKVENYPFYQDFFEYHGGTTIERTRRSAGKTVDQDWLMFDTIEAALDYFNNCCGI